jgi:hypothetical protein
MGTSALGGPIIGYSAEHFSVQLFTLLSAIFLILLILFWYKKEK